MYRIEFRPDHPRADSTGMVAVHLLVAEEKLGRSLEEGEIVHHCDFNRLHNEPVNLLELATRKEHQQLPAFQARFLIRKGLYEEFLEWWRVEKDKVDPVIELEKRLARLQNKQERIKAKLAKG